MGWKKILFWVIIIVIILFFLAAFFNRDKEPPVTPPIEPEPPQVMCGNGACDAGEDETSCPGDCREAEKGEWNEGHIKYLTDDPIRVAAWNAYKQEAIKEVYTSDEWGEPELLASNSPGWEDSAYVSGDGSKVYFFYMASDLFKIASMFNYHFGKLKGDPTYYSKYHRGPKRGVTPIYTSDVFVTNADGTAPLEKFELSTDNYNEWGLQYDNAWYWNYVPADTDGSYDIYRNNDVLDIPDRKKFSEDNPHSMTTEYGHELFFNSKDRSSGPESDIFVTKEVDGVWPEPVALAAPLNLPDSGEEMPFFNKGLLYFATSRDGWASISASKRLDEDVWEEPEQIVWVQKKYKGPRLWGVGEPSVTDDGQWLYFHVVFENEYGDTDNDVARVKRK